MRWLIEQSTRDPLHDKTWPNNNFEGASSQAALRALCTRLLKLDLRALAAAMNRQIVSFVANVAASCRELSSIWLIGSRANGTATSKSDWDFIAFGSEEAYECLQASPQIHRTRTDFLVVTNGNDFRNAWGETDKTGSLSKWEWKSVSDTVAEYTEAKWVEQEDGSGFKLTRSKAIRLWPPSEGALSQETPCNPLIS